MKELLEAKYTVTLTGAEMQVLFIMSHNVQVKGSDAKTLVGIQTKLEDALVESGLAKRIEELKGAPAEAK